MLTLNEIVDKLTVAPVQFKKMVEQERYSDAKWLFYGCMATAVFIEMDDVAMERLFGEQGAFEPEMVKMVYEKAGGGIDRSAEDYAEDARTRRDVRFLLYKERVLAGFKVASESIESGGVC